MNHGPARQDGDGVKVVVRGPMTEKAVGVLEVVVSGAAISRLNVGECAA